jgi:hypothetical protein
MRIKIEESKNKIFKSQIPNMFLIQRLIIMNRQSNHTSKKNHYNFGQVSLYFKWHHITILYFIILYLTVYIFK